MTPMNNPYGGGSGTQMMPVPTSPPISSIPSGSYRSSSSPPLPSRSGSGIDYSQGAYDVAESGTSVVTILLGSVLCFAFGILGTLALGILAFSFYRTEAKKHRAQVAAYQRYR